MRLPVKLWDKYFFLLDFTFTLMRKTDLIKTVSFCNIYCQILIHLGLIWLLQQKFSTQLWPHPWNSIIVKLNQAQQQQSFSLAGLSWSYFLITRPTTHPHTRESIIWQIERLNQLAVMINLIPTKFLAQIKSKIGSEIHFNFG